MSLNRPFQFSLSPQIKTLGHPDLRTYPFIINELTFHLCVCFIYSFNKNSWNTYDAQRAQECGREVRKQGNSGSRERILEWYRLESKAHFGPPQVTLPFWGSANSSIKMTPLLWAELCPLKFVCWSSNFQYLILGGKVFKEESKLKWDHWGGALIQCEECPHRKRKSHSGAQKMHFPAQKNDHVKRQQEGSHMQAKETDLRGL